MSFRAGDQGGAESFFSFEYGLQVFDLCADQICKLMEKPDMNKGKSIRLAINQSVRTLVCIYALTVTELGALPAMQYSVMGGGRFYPMVSREVSCTCPLASHSRLMKL